ncbi:MAG: ABC transporter permease [Eubacteriales bacterium]
MRNLLIVIKNILKRIFKKPSSYIIHLLVPIVVSVGIFLVYSMWSSSVIAMALCDYDKTEASSSLIAAIERTGKFEVIETTQSEAESMVADGDASFAYVIPADFEEKVLSNEAPEIVIYAVGQSEGTGWIEAISDFQIQNIRDMALAAEYDQATLSEMLSSLSDGAVTLESQSVADVTRDKETNVNSFGMYMMLLMISTITISLQLLEEKKMGTYTRIGMAPVNPKIYTLGNVSATMIVSTIQIVVLMAALVIFVNINFHMNPLVMFVIMWVFALCSASLGLMMAAFAKNANAAGTLISLVVSPSCMLAGCFWPISFMPDYMRKIAYITPQRWTLDAIADMQSGGGVAELMPSLLMVLAFTLLFFLMAAFKFKTDERRLG